MTPYKLTCGRIPVIIHVPHASTVFPKRLLEDSAVLNPEINLRESVETIADLHADRIADSFIKSSGLRPYVFTSTMSRMFFDPERFDSEDEEMNAAGMGVVYTKNHNGDDIYSSQPSEEHRRQRITKYYDVYSKAFTDTVDDVLRTYGTACILDLHSYSSAPLPYELHSEETRSPLVIGYDPYHIQSVMDPVSALYSRPYVSTNSVFKGSYVPLKHYHNDPRVSSVMFEVRKDVYMDEKSGSLKSSPYLESILEDMGSLVSAVSSAAVSSKGSKERVKEAIPGVK